MSLTISVDDKQVLNKKMKQKIVIFFYDESEMFCF
jgi:hypothetical protein